MPQRHLDALSHALTQKGWKIVSTRTLNDFPYDCHAWEIERGSASREIQFDRFGGMGEDVPLLESSGCSIEGHEEVHLSFSKKPRWPKELTMFVHAVDNIEM